MQPAASLHTLEVLGELGTLSRDSDLALIPKLPSPHLSSCPQQQQRARRDSLADPGMASHSLSKSREEEEEEVLVTAAEDMAFQLSQSDQHPHNYMSRTATAAPPEKLQYMGMLLLLMYDHRPLPYPIWRWHVIYPPSFFLRTRYQDDEPVKATLPPIER